MKENPPAGEEKPGRFEIETEVGNPRPELEAIKPARYRARIEQAVGGRPLEPAFETIVWRTTRMLRAPDGSEIELALDKGEIRGPRGSEPISEAEFELKSGAPGSVFSLAKDVLNDEEVRIMQASKAARGYRLAGCCRVAGISPMKADKISLRAGDTAGDAFGRIFSSCGRQVFHNIEAVLSGDDPEGPHQLRIGLRRLRCALRVHRKLIARKVVRDINETARKLSGIVGELRDIDVLIDEFVTPYASRHAPDDSAPAALLATLNAHRDRLRISVRSHLSSAEISKFQLNLLDLLEGGMRLPSRGRKARKYARASAREFARPILDKSWGRVIRYGQRIEQLSVSDRHEMRKALKNHRYITEFFAPLFPPKAVRRHTRRLKQLQTDFGYLNDIAMAHKIRDVYESEAGDDCGVYWTIGHIQGLNDAHAEPAWEAARANWKKLQNGRLFWS